MHTHIFPRFVREDRGRLFSSEPAFEALYRDPKARCAGASELVERLDEDRVDLAVTFGFPWSSRDLCSRHNDYVMEEVAGYPGRLKGFCCVPADAGWAAAEVGRCLAGGMSGVGELAFYDRDFSEDLIASCGDVMAQAVDFDVPVIVHANEPVGPGYPGKAPVTPGGIYRFVKAYPENRVILAHWGGGIFFYRVMKREVGETFSNVWFDTAASPYIYRPEIYPLAVSSAGRERIVFGSDFPLIPPQRYFDEMAETGLPSDDISAICGGNAMSLLGIPADGGCLSPYC